MDLAASLLGGGGSRYQVVNTYNRGTLPFLPDDAVIEVQASVGHAGATPLPVAPVDPLYAGLMANVTAYEDLALEAALRGDASGCSGRCSRIRWWASTRTPRASPTG